MPSGSSSPSGEHGAEDHAHHVEGFGHDDVQGDGQHIGGDGQQHIGLQDPQQLIGADEAPDAAVKAEEGEDQDADGAPGQDHLAVGPHKLGGDGVELKIEPEPEGKEKGDADAQNVHGADDDGLFAQAEVEALSFIYHSNQLEFKHIFRTRPKFFIILYHISGFGARDTIGDFRRIQPVIFGENVGR